MSQAESKEEARYLYCIADSGQSKDYGEIGLENNQVYTIPYKEICAVVHDCSAEPYDSDDEEKIKQWVKSHGEVLDQVMENPNYTALIPAGFDTIIQAKEGHTVEETVKRWLEKELESLVRQLRKVENREEYGVQVLYDPEWLSNNVETDSEEAQELREKIKNKSEGAAYMYKQQLEKLRKEKIDEKKESFISEFLELIKPTVNEAKREGTKDSQDQKKTLLNLPCLVEKGKYEELGEVLEGIDNRGGFSVRFTGPWPPFSFTELETDGEPN